MEFVFSFVLHQGEILVAKTRSRKEVLSYEEEYL